MSQLLRDFVFTEAGGRRAHAIWRLTSAALLMTGLGVVVLLAIQVSPMPAWPVFRPLGLSIAAVTTVTVLAKTLDRGRSIGQYGLDIDAEWLREAAVGFGLALAATGIPTVLAVAADWHDIVEVAPDGLGVLLLGGTWFLVYTVLVALWEELYFRGVVISNAIEMVGAASRTFAVPGGVLLGAWWFASVHRGHPDHRFLLGTWFLAGITFTGLYLATGRLALPLGAHAGYNAWHVIAVSDRTSDAEVVATSPALVTVEPAAGTMLVGSGGLVDAAGFAGTLLLGLAWIHRDQGCLENQWREHVSHLQDSTSPTGIED